MPTDSSGEFDLLDRLAEEFAARYRRGERPALKEYIDRYPHLAADIREVFPAMAAIEQIEEDRRRPSAPPAGLAAPALEQVGDYRILREVGRGGMGVVYEAEQLSLGRHVALKILPAQATRDRKARERFKREARAAARLHHTNIVPVFEVGQVGGVCFYAMQYIQGQGLDQVIEELSRLRSAAPAVGGRPPSAGSLVPWATPPTTPLAPGVPGVGPAALTLLTGRFHPALTPLPPSGATEGHALAGCHDPQVARGTARPDASPVQAAGNATSSALLPGQTDLSAARTGRRHYFRSVAQIGQQVAAALAYAHARGVVHRDVKPSNLLLDGSGVVWVGDFGLAKTEDDGLTNPGDIVGTLRYMAPERFRGECDVRADVYALGLTLYELLVLRPAFAESDRLRLIERIKNEEPPRPRALDPRVPRDLETVVLKAIHKEPQQRYPSADDLAEDLRRFLGDEPIKARRAAVPERIVRWARRHKGEAALLAVLALILVAATAASGVGVLLLRAAEGREHEARLDAERQRDALWYNLYASHVSLAQREWYAGNLAHAHELLDACVPRRPGERDLRGWEWYHLDRLRHGELRVLRGHTGDVNCVAYSPDGAHLASAGDDRTVRVWGATGAAEPLVFRGHTDDVTSVAYSPDGAWLASGGRDRTVRVWPTSGVGQPRVFGGHEGSVHCVAFSPDGKLLASGDRDVMVRLWNDAGVAKPRVLRSQVVSVQALAFSPDGSRLAAGGNDGSVHVWDVGGGEERNVLKVEAGTIRDLAFSPDGSRLALACDDGTVRVWDTDGGAGRRVLRGHATYAMSVAWSPDGTRLVSSGRDGTVRVWDAAAGVELCVRRGHTGEVNGVAWSPDGTRLASAGDDETVRIWDAAASDEPRTFRGHTEVISGLVFSPDGARLVSVSFDGTVRTWNDAAGSGGRLLGDQWGRLRCVAVSPDGKLAAAGRDGMVRLWEGPGGGEPRDLRGHSAEVFGVAFSRDGTRLASGAADGTIRVWDVTGGGAPRVLEGHDGTVNAVAFSPDGARLASAGRDGSVRLWDQRGGAELRAFKGQKGYVACVAYSPDGALLAWGDQAGAVWLWDTAGGAAPRALKGHTGRVAAVAFSPDGSRLASGGRDGTVRLWDPEGGAALGVLRSPAGDVNAVVFSPDGWRLAWAGSSRTILLADARPRDPADRPGRAEEASAKLRAIGQESH
jgi:WD40 repeat protein/tRNA A-37 threonylcarbamoyl transferase component Bud32